MEIKTAIRAASIALRKALEKAGSPPSGHGCIPSRIVPSQCLGFQPGHVELDLDGAEGRIIGRVGRLIGDEVAGPELFLDDAVDLCQLVDVVDEEAATLRSPEPP